MSYLKMALQALKAITNEGETPEAQMTGINCHVPDHTAPVEVPIANPPERILTCFECPSHEHDRINPSQGWGRCTLKKQGRYGCATACEAALNKIHQ